MPEDHGGHAPQTTRATTRTNRQLTLGECIAIARYGREYADGGRVGLVNILDTIDRLGVCTTCGWSRAMHVAAPGGALEEGICAHWTRAGVHN
jgi:hypothetical protein